MIQTNLEIDRVRILEELLGGGELLCREVFEAFADESVPPAWKGAVLSVLRVRGERPGELAGLAKAMLARAEGPFEVGAPTLVDTCGTGGDGSGSVNLSTAAALVVAALGIPVAKHGNRAVSSSAGSADLIEELGIPFSGSPAEATRALSEHGFAFLFAPAFHPATAGVAAVRRELGVRTVFNILGPLVNPARPTHQLTGTGDARTADLMAGALAELDVERAFVVTGSTLR